MSHFTETADAPLLISDREGSWLKNSINTSLHDKIDELEKLFSNEGWENFRATEGDPRNLMASHFDSIFMAVYKGQLGLITEAETNLVSEAHACVHSTTLTDLRFSEIVEAINQDMVALRAKYPSTIFFTSNTDANFHNRLCANAFTPIGSIEDIEEGVFKSPYDDKEAILYIDTATNELTF